MTLRRMIAGLALAASVTPSPMLAAVRRPLACAERQAEAQAQRRRPPAPPADAQAPGTKRPAPAIAIALVAGPDGVRWETALR